VRKAGRKRLRGEKAAMEARANRAGKSGKLFGQNMCESR
jgi:hypothetical protein